ncbi:MAG TPA: hypothetical protein VHK01_15295 [Lacipirellulaceae bacterium]|jgi:hypothetical protein|nr:hypothetical protein [Lacipirellulaceae bacterium]
MLKETPHTVSMLDKLFQTGAQSAVFAAGLIQESAAIGSVVPIHGFYVDVLLSHIRPLGDTLRR